MNKKDAIRVMLDGYHVYQPGTTVNGPMLYRYYDGSFQKFNYHSSGTYEICPFDPSRMVGDGWEVFNFPKYRWVIGSGENAILTDDCYANENELRNARLSPFDWCHRIDETEKEI